MLQIFLMPCHWPKGQKSVSSLQHQQQYLPSGSEQKAHSLLLQVSNLSTMRAELKAPTYPTRYCTPHKSLLLPCPKTNRVAQTSRSCQSMSKFPDRRLLAKSSYNFVYLLVVREELANCYRVSVSSCRALPNLASCIRLESCQPNRRHCP